MKTRNVLYALLTMLIVGTFYSCQKNEIGVHTNAAKELADTTTYRGFAYLAEDIQIDTTINSIDTTITVTVYDTISTNVYVGIKPLKADSLQAVEMHITCNAKVKNTSGKYNDVVMDQSPVFNIAKAGNNKYVFTSGQVSNDKAQGASFCSGKLDGDELRLTLGCTAKLVLSTASTIKYYTFVAKRSEN